MTFYVYTIKLYSCIIKCALFLFHYNEPAINQKFNNKNYSISPQNPQESPSKSITSRKTALSINHSINPLLPAIQKHTIHLVHCAFLPSPFDIFKQPFLHNPFAYTRPMTTAAVYVRQIYLRMPSFCVRKRGVSAGTIAEVDDDVKKCTHHHVSDVEVITSRWNEVGLVVSVGTENERVALLGF